jgi:uncharacterized protein (DUF4415 family)
MPKLKAGTIRVTDQEDAAITAAALSDPDAQPLTDEQLANLRPVRPRGRPAGSGKKIQVTMRLDEDIIAAFKEDGDGWQTRMNDALRQWHQEHRR